MAEITNLLVSQFVVLFRESLLECQPKSYASSLSNNIVSTYFYMLNILCLKYKIVYIMWNWTQPDIRRMEEKESCLFH